MKSPTSSIYSCKMEENSSVSEHILKMYGYHNHLTQLGIDLPVECVIDRVLWSLPPSYKGFVMNYNMQGMTKVIPEIFAMLKLTEVEIKKDHHQVLMVHKTTSFKKKGRGKKRNFKKNRKQVATPGRNPSLDLSLRLSASTAKGLVTGSGTAPSIWRIRRMAK